MRQKGRLGIVDPWDINLFKLFLEKLVFKELPQIFVKEWTLSRPKRSSLVSIILIIPRFFLHIEIVFLQNL